MYLSMIDWDIVFVKLEGSDFNDLTSFNTNARSCNRNVLIISNVLNARYNGIDNIMYATNYVKISWTLKKMFPIFQMWVFASILFSLQLIFMTLILL